MPKDLGMKQVGLIVQTRSSASQSESYPLLKKPSLDTQIQLSEKRKLTTQIGFRFIQALQKYLNQLCPVLMKILYELPLITRIPGFRLTTLADFSDANVRNQELKMGFYQTVPSLILEPHELDSI